MVLCSLSTRVGERAVHSTGHIKIFINQSYICVTTLRG